MQAQDVMSTEVAAIAADATVREAARAMLARRVSALPVVDGRRRVVGIVSEGDLVRRAELGTDRAGSWWLRVFADEAARDYVRTHGTLVRDVMSSPVRSVRRATPLREVARLLEKHRIKRLPVIEGGRLVGIVSRADLVRRLATAPARAAPRASGDRALRREILKAMQAAGLDLAYVNVTVESGVAHLWGAVRTPAEQRALRVAAKAVRGVRKVEDHSGVLSLRVAAGLGAL